MKIKDIKKYLNYLGVKVLKNPKLKDAKFVTQAILRR